MQTWVCFYWGLVGIKVEREACHHFYPSRKVSLGLGHTVQGCFNVTKANFIQRLSLLFFSVFSTTNFVNEFHVKVPHVETHDDSCLKKCNAYSCNSYFSVIDDLFRWTFLFFFLICFTNPESNLGLTHLMMHNTTATLYPQRLDCLLKQKT